MSKGTTTGEMDAYIPIALGQQDMRMLMTPLMRRFMAVVARKGLGPEWQFGAMPAQRRQLRCYWPGAQCRGDKRRIMSWPLMSPRLSTQPRMGHLLPPPTPHGGPVGAH